MLTAAGAAFIGEHINRIEAKVQKAHPTVKHIDIELN